MAEIGVRSVRRFVRCFLVTGDDGMITDALQYIPSIVFLAYYLLPSPPNTHANLVVPSH